MQDPRINEDFKENIENLESFYFKVFEFKEDFINQIISKTELIQNYLNKANSLIQFHDMFKILQKNRLNMKESKIIFYKI